MNFDEKAKDWDKDLQRVERAKLFAGEIKKHIGNLKTGKALEFGSGTGLVSFQLKDQFKTITLADTSKGMVDVLIDKIKKESITNMKPVLTDIFSDNHIKYGFEVIYTLLTLHHIKDIDKTFEIFFSLLKPGGYVCIGDLVTEDGSFHYRDPEFDGHLGFDQEEMATKLLKTGFKVDINKVFHVIEREHNNTIKKYPLFLIIARKQPANEK